MVAGQEGNIVDAILLDDGSILFGHDISYLPSRPHIATIAPDGTYREIMELPAPSYSAFRIPGGGFVISSDREPGGDLYPPGEIYGRLWTSPDGEQWEEALRYPWASSSEAVHTNVYWQLASGELVLSLSNAQGFGPGGRGYQLLRVDETET